MFFHILPVSSAGIIIGPIWQDSLHLVLTFLAQHCQHAVHVLGRCLTRARPSNMSACLKNIGRPNFCVAFDRKCFSLSWFSSHTKAQALAYNNSNTCTMYSVPSFLYRVRIKPKNHFKMLVQVHSKATVLFIIVPACDESSESMWLCTAHSSVTPIHYYEHKSEFGYITSI